MEYDVIILGAGAAGMGAAQYAARANLKTLVVEEMAHGGQALLIDKLENYPGVEMTDGYAWAEVMKRQAEAFGAEFVNGTVTSVRKAGARFELALDSKILYASVVIAATGAKHRHAGLKGEEEFAGRGVSYCATCDGPFFKGRKVLVVGGGDSACDEAMFLSKLAEKVIMVHRKDRFRAQKAVAARVLSNQLIDVRFDSVVEEIRGTKSVESVRIKNLVDGNVYDEAVSAVFVFVGSEPQTQCLPEELKKDETGSIITDESMMTSIAGLFAAGDVRATQFRQVVTAVADGALAAHSAARYIDALRGNEYL